MDNSMVLSCSSSTSTISPKPTEVSKASPLSLCENQNPSPPPLLLPAEKVLNPDMKTAKLTLGQTLRNELRKSSIRIHNYQKETEEEDSLVVDCEQEEEDHLGDKPHVQELHQNDAATATSLVEDSTTVAELPLNGVLARRRRPRRNPVWLYFQVEEGQASCKHCDYKTKSIFSTNLKVHLKSHHRKLFDQVLEAEEVMAAATENAAQAMKALKQNNEDIFPAVRRAYYSAMTEGPQEDYELQQKPLNCPSPPPSTQQRNRDTGRNEDQTISCNSGGNQGTSYLSAALTNFNAPFSSMKALTDLLANPLPTAASATNSPHPLEEVCNGQFVDQQPLTIQSALASLSSEWTGSHLTAPTATTNSPTASSTTNEQQYMAEKFKQKRKRLRRHPVWTFFKDFEDKIVGCVMCNFRTTSAFSTNLKMHLRAHHKQEYLQVMESELEQCVDGGGVRMGEEVGTLKDTSPMAFAHHSFENSLQAVEVSGRTGRVKRKRKTAEELQMIIEKCKSNMEREKEKRSSMLLASARSNKSSRKSSVPEFSSYSAAPMNLPEKMPSSNSLSASDQLNALIAGMLTSGNTTSHNNCSPSTQLASFAPANDIAYSSPTQNVVNGDSCGSPASQINEQDDLKEFLNHLNEVTENETNRELLALLRKQARDFAFSKLAQTMGSIQMLSSPAFQLFVYALAPEYELINLDEIHQQQQLYSKINH